MNKEMFLMNPLTRLLSIGLIAAAAALVPAHVAEARTADPVVPSELVVPDGNKLFLVGHAVGVQIYSCNATPGGPAWVLVGPRANVYDDHGKLIMTHYAGPSWRARDGSVVVGHKQAGVTVDPTAVDWLKLSATSTSAGSDGDLLVATTFVQRLATSGGVAPSVAQCTTGTTGSRVEVPYTADYYFWRSADE
jgi:hypothetical protein